jgi:integrase
MNLKWHSVNFYEKRGERYLAMVVNGKTGEREVTIRHSAIRYLDRLRCMNPEWAKLTFDDFIKMRVDTYVFRVDGKDMTAAFSRMFARYLERVELLLDKSTGKPRTLYSLRHMYATFALTFDRMSVYTLARHMGTSVAMIEAHYGQLLLRDKAAEIADTKAWKIENAKRGVGGAKKATKTKNADQKSPSK